MSDNKITVQSVETNVLYMGVMALDLILRDAERRMRATRGEFKACELATEIDNDPRYYLKEVDIEPMEEE